MTNTHSVAKALVYAFVLIALTTSSGLLSHRNAKSTSVMPFDNLLLGDDVDTCGIEIMERFNCTEVACTDQANYINYLYLQNCSAPAARPWLSLLWVFILILLLSLLASTADKYFCVVMESIVDKLHIPPSIAGVTFLAFGNGAPDVFSLVMSVMAGMTEIGVGANTGAGMFVTSVVAGLIAVTSNCTVNKRAFLRDIIFYICSVIYLIIVFFDKHITIWEAIGFILIYFIYITIVLIHPKKHAPKTDMTDEEKKSLMDEITAADAHDLILSPGSPSVDGKQGTGMQITAIMEARLHNEPMDKVIPELVMKQSPKPGLEEVVAKAEAETPRVEFNHRSIPELWNNAYTNFKNSSWMSKIFYIIEYPFTILRDITCPIVEEERWNKYWLLISSVGAPFIIAFFSDVDMDDTFIGMPVWLVLTILSVILLICNALLTSFEEAPAKGFYLVVLVLLGFVSSVLWISAVAEELVSLLNAIGLMVNISPAVLGLTILAWGNSLGDIVADVSLATQGYPQMAIGGVYAAPMFNMLIGMGTSLLIGCARSGAGDLGEDTASVNLTFIFLLISLLSTLITVTIQKWHFSKGLGIYLFCLYALYLILNVLVELGIVTLPFITPQA